MLYDYECEECGFLMEDVYQSIKEDAFTNCPKCKKESFNRIIYGGTYASVKKEPTTIGQLAERRFEEGHTTMPDGRPITRIEWNKADMVEKAEKMFRKSLSLHDLDETALYNMACLYSLKKNEREAMYIYTH